MKLKTVLLSLLAATGIACAGNESVCDYTPGKFFYNSMIPGDDIPEFKKQLFEKFGTSFAAEVGIGFWAIDNQAVGYNSDNYIAKFWSHIDQRLIKDDEHGGTWLRADFMGSWGLDDETANVDSFFDGGFGSATWHNTDLFGPRDFYLLNLTLKQYFDNKRGCFSGGIIWMSQYFDRIGHARFANDAFEKSPVLPLVWQAPGAVIQYEFNEDNYGTLAFIGTGVPGGQNPYNFENTIGYAIVGEWGHEFADDKGIWRVAPFFTCEEAAHHSGRNMDRNAYGIMTGVEYQLNDIAKVYGRLACASSNYIRCRQEAMVGTTLRIVPSRPNDYLGVGFGIYKGNDETRKLENSYEKVLEFTYNVQLGKNFTIAPYYQVYFTPAYRDVSTVSATGIQAHYSF